MLKAFLLLHCSYVKSFMGMPLDQLAALHDKPAAGPGAAAAAAPSALALDQATEALAGLGLLSDLSSRSSNLSDSPALPKEIRQLVAWLGNPANGALQTQGLFVASMQHVLGVSVHEAMPAPWSRAHVRQALQVLAPLREALDQGLPLPEGCNAHHVALLLLLVFVQLPASFMPRQMVQACNGQSALEAESIPAIMGACMGPTETAVAVAALALCKQVAAPAAAVHTNVTLAELARLLAALWFPPLTSSAPPEAAGNREALVQHLLQ